MMKKVCLRLLHTETNMVEHLGFFLAYLFLGHFYRFNLQTLLFYSSDKHMRIFVKKLFGMSSFQKNAK